MTDNGKSGEWNNILTNSRDMLSLTEGLALRLLDKYEEDIFIYSVFRDYQFSGKSLRGQGRLSLMRDDMGLRGSKFFLLIFFQYYFY